MNYSVHMALWEYEGEALIESLDDLLAHPLKSFCDSRIAARQAKRVNLRNVFMQRAEKDFTYAGTECADDALVGTDDPLGKNHMTVDEEITPEIIAEITDLYNATYTDEYGREWRWCTSSGGTIPAMATMTYKQARVDWKATRRAIETNLARLQYKTTDSAGVEWSVMLDADYVLSEGYYGAITTREDAIVPGAHVNYGDVGAWAGFPPAGTYTQWGYGPDVPPGEPYTYAYVKFGFCHPGLLVGPWIGLGWCGVENITATGRIYPLHYGVPCTWGDLMEAFPTFEPKFKLTGRMFCFESGEGQEIDLLTCSGHIVAETSEGHMEMSGPWYEPPLAPLVSEYTEYGTVVNETDTEITFDVTGTIECVDDDPDKWHGYPDEVPYDEAGNRHVGLTFYMGITFSES